MRVSACTGVTLNWINGRKTDKMQQWIKNEDKYAFHNRK